MKKILSHLGVMIAILFLVLSCGPKWIESEKNGIRYVDNADGQKLGYSPTSGVTLLTADRYGFKDLNKNGSLDPYEDWRLSAQERATDLASQMTKEQIAGLMLVVRMTIAIFRVHHPYE